MSHINAWIYRSAPDEMPAADCRNILQQPSFTPESYLKWSSTLVVRVVMGSKKIELIWGQISRYFPIHMLKQYLSHSGMGVSIIMQKNILDWPNFQWMLLSKFIVPFNQYQIRITVTIYTFEVLYKFSVVYSLQRCKIEQRYAD